MIKSIATALVAAAATLGAGAAQAGHVSWSIDINTPVVGTVISNLPVYAPAAVYAPVPVYLPAPAVYVQAPVYREAPPVAWYPGRSTYYRPVPVAYAPYYRGWHHDRHRWEGRGWRHD